MKTLILGLLLIINNSIFLNAKEGDKFITCKFITDWYGAKLINTKWEHVSYKTSFNDSFELKLNYDKVYASSLKYAHGALSVGDRISSFNCEWDGFYGGGNVCSDGFKSFFKLMNKRGSITYIEDSNWLQDGTKSNIKFSTRFFICQ